MKRFLAGALALTLLGGTAISAQAQTSHRGPAPHAAPVHVQAHGLTRVQTQARFMPRPAPKPQVRRFSRGQFAPPAFRHRSRFVDYRRAHLRAPVRGYQWVKADNQYLLIVLASGFIAQAIAAH